MFTNVEILFASNNEHKVDEVRAALPRQFTIRSLREVMGDVDIPETGVTLQENAAIKARFLFAETVAAGRGDRLTHAAAVATEAAHE